MNTDPSLRDKAKPWGRMAGILGATLLIAAACPTDYSGDEALKVYEGSEVYTDYRAQQHCGSVAVSTTATPSEQYSHPDAPALVSYQFTSSQVRVKGNCGDSFWIRL
jgi:hypothetical protein